MLIRELLEEKSESLLFEDLGTLKIVNPDLLASFKTGYKKSTLGPKFGRNSPISSRIFKSSSAALDKFEKDENVIAVIIRDYESDEQIALLTKRAAVYGKEKGYSSMDRHNNLAIRRKGLTALGFTPSELNDFGKKLPGKYLSPNDITSENGINHGATYKALTAIKNLLTSKDRELGFLVISVDTDRKEKGEKRAAGREGMIPLPSQTEAATAFKKLAKNNLADKLEAFKSNKIKASKAANNLEELMKIINDDGYLDKIAINGYVYDYYKDNISMKGLKGDKFYGDSFIEYSLNNKTPEYKEMSKKIKEIRNAMWEKTITKEEAMNQMKDVGVMPKRFLVKLKLAGGKIVPDKIDFEDVNESYYYYID